MIFLEYAIDVADACREAGVKAVAVTAGYMCAQPRAEFFGHIDAANVDLKGFTGDFYRRICLATLDPVLETLLYLRHETGVWLEITNLLIPGLNDSDGDIDAHDPVGGRAARAGRAGALHRVPPGLQDAGPAAHARRRRWPGPGASPWTTASATPTPATCTTRPARAPAATHCGALVIERDWYRLGTWRLTGDGRCANCDTPLPGVFDGPPGTWGPRRLPVRIVNQ